VSVPNRHGWTSLPLAEQGKLDEMVLQLGVGPTAAKLGVSTITVEALWGGGTARKVTIERVAKVIRERGQ
jgi:hypothetical protein